MTIDYNMECVAASTMISTLGRDTKCEEMDLIGEDRRGSVSSDDIRDIIHGDNNVLANHDFQYGNEGGCNKDWLMLSQDDNNPGNHEGNGNPRNSNNNTSSNTRGRAFRIGVADARTITTW